MACCRYNHVNASNRNTRREWPPAGEGTRCVCRLHPAIPNIARNFKQPPRRETHRDPIHAAVPQKFATETIYKSSYQLNEGKPATGGPIYHAPSLCPMERTTTTQSTYKAHRVQRPRSPIRVCRRRLIGGPGTYDLVTTQKHDYVKKPDMFVPCPKPRYHEQIKLPVSDRTINRVDFKWPAYSRTKFIVPPVLRDPVNFPVESESIQRMSYQKRGAYEKYKVPTKKIITSPLKMEGNTTYKQSYGSRYEILDAEDQRKDPCPEGCHCSQPGECLRSAKPLNLTTCSCNCHYPKAAFPNPKM